MAIDRKDLWASSAQPFDTPRPIADNAVSVAGQHWDERMGSARVASRNGEKRSRKLRKGEGGEEGKERRGRRKKDEEKEEERRRRK